MNALAPRSLSMRSLAGLPASVRRPAYDRAAVRCGIVHLGVGNFHRAHQAAYADAALAAGDPRWGICGVSLRQPAMRDALAPQDGLYALVERDAACPGGRASVIGALRELLVAPEDPGAVARRIAESDTRIVTLTVTEKGYCRAAQGGLDPTAAEVAHDLADPSRPASAVGLLHAAARARRDAGAVGFTVLSCDNLSGNGSVVRRLLLEFDAMLSAAGGQPRPLAAWIERELAFPDSMVDRIVPHTTDEHRALAQGLLGVRDAWPVVTEPFAQWVVQDRFAAGRPRWEDFGVSFVDDVAPWEQMKLRLLNAAHTSLACLGQPAGFDTVDRAIAEPALHAFVETLWRDEVVPTLPQAVRSEAAGYCHRLLARFANPALGHRTSQIAMDGSQKVPLRLLPTLRLRLSAGQPFERLAMAVAAWVRYLRGVDERGASYPVSDPMADRFAARLAAAGPDPKAIAAAALSVPEVFGDDLSREARVLEAVARQLGRLLAMGTVGALAAPAIDGGRA